MIKVIAFDCFGTVYDMAGVPREEIEDYGRQLRREEWAPLQLPTAWHRLQAHADAAEGLQRLRNKGYRVVTLSNGPLVVQVDLAASNGIHWDAILPLEAYRVYKPSPAAYCIVPELMRVHHHEVMVVTANAKFGDIEEAGKLGMVGQLIRNPGTPANILDLAKQLP